jgi:hypothetical protein
MVTKEQRRNSISTTMPLKLLGCMRVCARHPERSRRMLMKWYVKVKYISTPLNVTERHAERSGSLLILNND